MDLALDANLDLNFENDLVPTRSIAQSMLYALNSKKDDSSFLESYGLSNFGKVRQSQINNIDEELSAVFQNFIDDGLISDFAISSSLNNGRYQAGVTFEQTVEQARANPILETDDFASFSTANISPPRVVETTRFFVLDDGGFYLLDDGGKFILR